MSQYSLLLLPYDIFVNIIKYLDLRDLRNLMLTCKTLRDAIINENATWRILTKKKLIIRHTLNRYLKPLPIYHQCRVTNNWCKGIFRNQIIVQHRANYMPWLRLHSECLYLSLQSNLICYPLDKKGYPNCKRTLWTIEVPKVKRNDVRTNDISRFVIKDNIIVCGNRDGSATIYAYENNRSPYIFYHIQDCHRGGQFEVSAVELINKKCSYCVITASSYSPELCLWYWRDSCYNTNNSLTHLEHHIFNCDTSPMHPVEMGLRSLAVNQMQDKLAIGLNRNNKPILFDITTCELLTNADDTRNSRKVVRDIQWHDENTIVFVTHYGTLELIDIRTNNVVYKTEDPFQASLYCVKSYGNNAIVVGAAEYSRCVLYDLRKTNPVQVYFTQKTASPIYSLDFDCTKLIAAADRSTAILNFNVSVSITKDRDYSLTLS